MLIVEIVLFILIFSLWMAYAASNSEWYNTSLTFIVFCRSVANW